MNNSAPCTIRRLGRALVLMLLLSAGFVVPGVPAALPARVQPALLALAHTEPDTPVSVIVQKQRQTNAPEQALARLGGTRTRDLSIINGFAATLPAGGVPALAEADGVRWVSENGPVVKTDLAYYTAWATAPGSVAPSGSALNFNATSIPAGRTIWFSSVLQVNSPSVPLATVSIQNASVQFTSGGTTYNVPVPDARVIFDAGASQATTSFDATNNLWVTRVPWTINGNAFAAGAAFQVPVALPASIQGVTYAGQFTSDTPGLSLHWQWGAAVYTNFSTTDYTALGVKPIDASQGSAYNNSDRAGSPENYKAALVAGALGYGGTNYTGGPGGSSNLTPNVQFNNVENMLDWSQGPNSTFASGSNIGAPLAGFTADAEADHAIVKVEAVLQLYVGSSVNGNIRLTPSLNGQAGTTVNLTKQVLNQHIGAANVALVAVDLTSSRTWNWSDFASGALQLLIDQTHLRATNTVYYDAVGLRITSQPANGSYGPVSSNPYCNTCFLDTSKLSVSYPAAIRATELWNQPGGPGRGEGVGVAIVDSGVLATRELGARLVASVNFNSENHRATDGYGHGTFVAGLVAGDGTISRGSVIGIAPEANIVNVRVTNDAGQGYESDVVAGLQWVLDNKETYNIRVVNLSLNATTAQDYNVDPLDAAVEVLWFNSIVVVVSAGNQGSSALFPPANDPFVITVGAADDHGTPGLIDDVMPAYSAYGVTEAGFAKPDLVAPGSHIVGVLSQRGNLELNAQHPEAQVGTIYFRMSGTSVAAPLVAGAVADMLGLHPALTPDQVKYRLKATAVHDPGVWPAYDAAKAGAGYLDAEAAGTSLLTNSANTGINASQMLWTGPDPVTWGSVSWNSVSWNSVSWNSVSWNSVSWNSVSWNSDYWGP